MEQHTPELEGIARMLANSVLSRVCAVAIHSTLPATPIRALGYGSGAFIDSGTHRFFVTAGHVLEAFDAVAETNPNAVLLVSGDGRPIDIRSWRRLDRRADIDLATVEVPEGFDLNSIGATAIRWLSWPPQRVSVGEYVVLAGAPGGWRATRSDLLEGVGVHTVGECVASVSDRHFIVVPGEEGQTYVQLSDVERIDFIGGMSGGPVFCARKADERSMPQLELCGYIYNGAGGCDEAQFFVHHADFVRSNGTIDHTLPPFA